MSVAVGGKNLREETPGGSLNIESSKLKTMISIQLYSTWGCIVTKTGKEVCPLNPLYGEKRISRYVLMCIRDT